MNENPDKMEKEVVLQRIKKMSSNHLTLLVPCPGIPEKDMVLVPLDNYREAMDLTLYLLKTCIMALQGDYEADSVVGEPEFNIGEILKLVTHLMPYEEMEFLDQVNGLMKELDKN